MVRPIYWIGKIMHKWGGGGKVSQHQAVQVSVAGH